MKLALALVLATIVLPSDEDVLRNAHVALTPRAVTAALTHEHPDVRSRAASLLGRWRTVIAIPHLKRTLDDPLPYVRIAAAGALLQIGEPAGAEALRRELHAHSVTDAVAAARHLAGAGDLRGLAALKERLRKGNMADLDRLLVVRFFASVLPHARAQVEDVLIAHLKKDRSAQVRMAIAEDFAKSGDANCARWGARCSAIFLVDQARRFRVVDRRVDVRRPAHRAVRPRLFRRVNHLLARAGLGLFSDAALVRRRDSLLQ